ncbi:hypothetical protein AVEN_20839-1 [Araneus ventricosus]|uniref:Uncharacterized protein n=1 Tax=Araneus ventricosus TaxID=182803 RepID=A0A4Y2T7B8_ARAVE|nr:hypothetical protein AVEN_20839-1 [Araneus ventricosus]
MRTAVEIHVLYWSVRVNGAVQRSITAFSYISPLHRSVLKKDMEAAALSSLASPIMAFRALNSPPPDRYATGGVNGLPG